MDGDNDGVESGGLTVIVFPSVVTVLAGEPVSCANPYSVQVPYMVLEPVDVAYVTPLNVRDISLEERAFTVSCRLLEEGNGCSAVSDRFPITLTVSLPKLAT